MPPRAFSPSDLPLRLAATHNLTSSSSGAADPSSNLDHVEMDDVADVQYDYSYQGCWNDDDALMHHVPEEPLPEAVPSTAAGPSNIALSQSSRTVEETTAHDDDVHPRPSHVQAGSSPHRKQRKPRSKKNKDKELVDEAEFDNRLREGILKDPSLHARLDV